MKGNNRQLTDLTKVRRIHFVGIKGVAMAALAVYASQRGIHVSGSDIAEEFPTEEILREAGIVPSVGFEGTVGAANKLPDAVIYTGAHGGRDNPQVVAAGKLGIPVFAHGKALGLFMRGYRQVSVAGSHGKTTTSAMVVTILCQGRMDPSYAIGCGRIFGLGSPGHYGKSRIFVAEADEYATDPAHDATPRFLWQTPEILAVTNIDYDHPDVYPSLAHVQKAFSTFQEQQTGERVTIVNIDDPASHVLLTPTSVTVVTYGCSPRADFCISHVGFGAQRTFFTLAERGIGVGEFTLKVPGRHNAQNATAAALTCRALGLSWDVIRNGLLAFDGTKRRFEKIGTARGVTFYDDYAHHPVEIQATIEAMRQWYPKRRIITVFQPHTYTRTKALLGEFSRCFVGSDLVILTDIYASAREHEMVGVTGAKLVEETSKHHPHVLYTNDQRGVLSILKRQCADGDSVLFMGAGSIYGWARSIAEQLSKKE